MVTGSGKPGLLDSPSQGLGYWHPLLLQALAGCCATWSGWQSLCRHAHTLIPLIMGTLGSSALRDLQLMQVQDAGAFVSRHGCLWGCMLYVVCIPHIIIHLIIHDPSPLYSEHGTWHVLIRRQECAAATFFFSLLSLIFWPAPPFAFQASLSFASTLCHALPCVAIHAGSMQLAVGCPLPAAPSPVGADNQQVQVFDLNTGLCTWLLPLQPGPGATISETLTSGAPHVLPQVGGGITSLVVCLDLIPPHLAVASLG